MSEVLAEKQNVLYQKTANKLYKEYKNEGGTLSFKDFIQREKDKGVFPLNIELNDDIQASLISYKQNKKEEDMNKKILGLPVKTLVIAGSLILISLVAYKIIKNRQQ
jgi:hypothetical protein